jgi:aminoglycoside phosphotransferase (APT) family kinase protein
VRLSAGRDWAPERLVGAAEAAALVGAQFPELRGAPVEPLATGWDNTVHLVGGEWIFRFPRREVALPGVRRELSHLPRLAASLPAPIPVPALVGRPSEAFPWPFWGARLIPGHELAEAEPLAQPPDDALRLAHGDLHQRHVLVDGDGAVAGVIDWGDLCLADPAVDLSIAYGAFAGPARAALLAAYGGIDPEREVRARVLALSLCAALAEYAADENRPALLRESLAGLRRAVA